MKVLSFFVFTFKQRPCPVYVESLFLSDWPAVDQVISTKKRKKRTIHYIIHLSHSQPQFSTYAIMYFYLILTAKPAFTENRTFGCHFTFLHIIIFSILYKKNMTLNLHVHV